MLVELHDPRTGRIDAQRVSDYLNVPLTRLARALGMNYTTVHKTPAAPSIQGPLAPIKRSLEILENMLGERATVLAWLNSPNPDLGMRTPIEVILEGQRRGPPYDSRECPRGPTYLMLPAARLRGRHGRPRLLHEDGARWKRGAPNTAHQVPAHGTFAIGSADRLALLAAFVMGHATRIFLRAGARLRGRGPGEALAASPMA